MSKTTESHMRPSLNPKRKVGRGDQSRDLPEVVARSTQNHRASSDPLDGDINPTDAGSDRPTRRIVSAPKVKRTQTQPEDLSTEVSLKDLGL